MVLKSGLTDESSFQQSSIQSVTNLGELPKADNLGRYGKSPDVSAMIRSMISEGDIYIVICTLLRLEREFGSVALK